MSGRYTADELDALAVELLRLVPVIRAAAKAMRGKAPPAPVRAIAKKAKRQAKAVKKAPRKAIRKVATQKAMRNASKRRGR